MLKIKKQTERLWQGNGFGTQSADWIVVDHPHILISEFGSGWNATDTKTDKRIIRGAITRKRCLEQLEVHIQKEETLIIRGRLWGWDK